MATTICYQIDQIFGPKWMTSFWVWIKDISIIRSNYYLEWILCFFSADSEQTQQWHGNKPNKKLSPPGIHRGPRPAASLLWDVSVLVRGHICWEPGHHPGHHLRPPPPHPHVLLSLQPVICRHRFHLHNHPKDAMEHPDIEQRYHLWRLHDPDIFFSLYLDAWTL